MAYEKELLALLHIKNGEKFGSLQTVGVSVNYQSGTANNDAVKKDLEHIVTLAGGGLKKTSVVSANQPFPHGFVELFFENEILVRYSFTETKAKAYKDWRLYLTDAEAYLREGTDKVEILIAKPESKPDVYSIQMFAKEVEEKELSATDESEIASIVTKLIG